jgi:hypothetical protein
LSNPALLIFWSKTISEYKERNKLKNASPEQVKEIRKQEGQSTLP